MKIKHKIQVNGPFHGYDYRVAEPEKIQIISYAGMSLQEIKSTYGENCAQHVYTMAARHGVDLTTDDVVPSTFKYKQFVDVEVEVLRGRRKFKILLTLKNNPFTIQSEDTEISNTEFVYSGNINEQVNHVANLEIKRIFGEILC